MPRKVALITKYFIRLKKLSYCINLSEMSKLLKKLFFDPALFIWPVVFCIVPFLQSIRITDPDYVPKMFAFGIIIVLWSVYFAFQPASLRLFDRRLLLFWFLLGGYVLTAVFSLFKSLNTGDG